MWKILETTLAVKAARSQCWARCQAAARAATHMNQLQRPSRRMTTLPRGAAAQRPEPESWESYPSRPPVIAVMGHVDHGKTTILDRLRHTNVAQGEAGGITQHIGAFTAELPSKQTVTLLDTPGHAAFMAMRARGAAVTDMVILVVAADDGVMPQTLEAIRHIKAAGVPLVVAVNKMDRAGADLPRVQGALAEHGVLVESYGGEVPCVGVSALTGAGFDALEEAVLAVAAVEDWRGDPTGVPEGYVLEARRDPHRGPVASVLLTRGTLRPRDLLVSGEATCRVRTMTSSRGQALKTAGPSTPVEIAGWRELPMAGDLVLGVASEDAARRTVAVARDSAQSARAAAQTAIASGPTALPLVLCADVQGTLEAIRDALAGLPFQDEVAVRVASGKVGRASEADVAQAAAIGAPVVIFGRAQAPGRALLGRAAQLGVAVKHFSVIYDLIADVKHMLAERLPPVCERETLGEAHIEAAFGARDGGRVAGCRVLTGSLRTGENVIFEVFGPAADRLESHQRPLWSGRIKELRHLKLRVDQITAPRECGVLFEGYNSFPLPARLVCVREVMRQRVVP